MNKLLVVAMATMVLSTSSAFAQMGEGEHGVRGGNSEKRIEHMFEKNDTDHDGVISKAEFLASAEERFAKMDADGDGKITKEEASAHHQKMHDKMKEHKAGEETPKAPQ